MMVGGDASAHVGRIDTGFHDALHIGIDHQRVVAVSSGELERLRPVAGEIDPRTVDHLTGEVGEDRPDDLLRPIGAAGVDNAEGIDEGAHRAQTTLDHVRLILDDHRQDDARDHVARHEGLRIEGSSSIARFTSSVPSFTLPPAMSRTPRL